VRAGGAQPTGLARPGAARAPGLALVRGERTPVVWKSGSPGHTAGGVKSEAESCMSVIPGLFRSSFDKVFDVVCISAAAERGAFVH